MRLSEPIWPLVPSLSPLHPTNSSPVLPSQDVFPPCWGLPAEDRGRAVPGRRLKSLCGRAKCPSQSTLYTTKTTTAWLVSYSPAPLCHLEKTRGGRWDGKIPGLKEMAWRLHTTSPSFFHPCHFAKLNACHPDCGCKAESFPVRKMSQQGQSSQQNSVLLSDSSSERESVEFIHQQHKNKLPSAHSNTHCDCPIWQGKYTWLPGDLPQMPVPDQRSYAKKNLAQNLTQGLYSSPSPCACPMKVGR